MKAIRVALILPLMLAAALAQDAQYFPSAAFDSNPQDKFKEEWYTKHLKALDEPSLLKKTKGAHVYRFLWLRSFHHPVAVRLNVNDDGASIVTVKVTNGEGGYEPGKLVKNRTVKLSKQQTRWFLERIDDLGYWDLPTREAETPNVLNIDGAQWVLEAVKGGRYKVVDRWSPDEGPVHILGLIMLIDLAQLKLLYQEVY